MNRIPGQKHLLVLLIVSIVTVLVVEKTSVLYRERDCAASMHEATTLCAGWFDAVGDYKRKHGISSDAGSVTRYRDLIGDDYTLLTTTLGSLEAKETAANPAFAALVYRLLVEAGLDSNCTVGVTLSGSFPSLAVAALAGIQTLGARAVVISSLGSSTFGANQPEATWIDIERWLRNQAGLKYASSVVTYGAEYDNGGGVTDEGLAMMAEAAARCSVVVFMPEELGTSITYKTELLQKAGTDLLINIGGNQAALGRGAGAAIMPNGFHQNWSGVRTSEPGVVARMAENGVPFVHLLNIKELAARYGLPISPGAEIAPSPALYAERHVNPLGPILGIGLLLSLVVGGRVHREQSGNNNGTNDTGTRRRTPIVDGETL